MHHNATFVATILAAVLLLLMHGSLNTGAQSGNKSTERVVYEILPGLQKLDASGDPQSDKPSLWTTSIPGSDHPRGFDLIIAGELDDLDEWRNGQLTQNQPVYSIIKHVSGDNAKLTAKYYIPNPALYKC